MGKYLYKKTREAFYDLIDDRGVIQETDFINWMNKIIKEKYPNNFDNRIEIHTFTMIKKLCEHLKINAISVSPVLIKGMYEIESIIFELDNMKFLIKGLK